MDVAAIGRQDDRTRVRRAYLRYLGDEQAKKNRLRPWKIKSWCIPKGSARFIAKMEDVLSVYQRPYDPRRPVVCLDEKGKELRSHTVGREEQLPQANPSREQLHGTLQDYEYKREGSANIFLACEPLRGWRRTKVTNDRTAHTFAQQLQKLVDEDYVDAERIVLITDNLNIHGTHSLYELLDPKEARRIAEKIEWHYTPEHGSWLNMAELELSALGRQCLSRRIPNIQTLAQECEAWTKARNQAKVTIDWHFTTRQLC